MNRFKYNSRYTPCEQTRAKRANACPEIGSIAARERAETGPEEGGKNFKIHLTQHAPVCGSGGGESGIAGRPSTWAGEKRRCDPAEIRCRDARSARQERWRWDSNPRINGFAIRSLSPLGHATVAGSGDHAGRRPPGLPRSGPRSIPRWAAGRQLDERRPWEPGYSRALGHARHRGRRSRSSIGTLVTRSPVAGSAHRS
jgi:hypothetical protein